MRTKAIIAAGIAAAVLSVAGVAYGATTVTITGTASTKPATKAKPSAFTAKWSQDAVDSGGGRPAAPITWAWKWTGVTINQKGFPACSAAKIDAAQSDSVCPKGSLVGKSTLITAKLGPSTDKNTNVTCSGKTVLMYNGGGNTVIWFIVGPGTDCAGLVYFPPFTAKLKTSGGSTTQTVTWPENIRHSLPGLDGGMVAAKFNFDSPSRTDKGKKVYYMQNNGCKGNRTLNFVVKDDEGSHTNKVNVGKCSK